MGSLGRWTAHEILGGSFFRSDHPEKSFSWCSPILHRCGYCQSNSLPYALLLPPGNIDPRRIYCPFWPVIYAATNELGPRNKELKSISGRLVHSREISLHVLFPSWDVLLLLFDRTTFWTLILWEKQNGRNGMEVHGTSGVREFDTINGTPLQVDIATFKPSAKNPQCGTANTPYLKVVRILFCNSMWHEKSTSFASDQIPLYWPPGIISFVLRYQESGSRRKNR